MKFKPIFRGFIIGAIVLFALAVLQFYTIGKINEVSFYQAFSEIIKVILVGFVIGVLGILIPQMLPNKKYDFAMKREAKEKYSEAKTEIDYMANTLQFINSPKEALEYIKKVHTHKHLAECYAEFLPVKNLQGRNDSAKIWHKNFLPYERIESCKIVIQENVEQWDVMAIGERYNKLVKSINLSTQGQ